MPHHWLPQINTAPQILSNKTLKEICENVRMQGKQFKASFTQDFKSFSTNVDGLNCSRSTNQLLVAYVNSECYTCCCKPIILVVLSTFLTNSIQHSLYIVSAPVWCEWISQIWSFKTVCHVYQNPCISTSFFSALCQRFLSLALCEKNNLATPALISVSLRFGMYLWWKHCCGGYCTIRLS